MRGPTDDICIFRNPFRGFGATLGVEIGHYHYGGYWLLVFGRPFVKRFALCYRTVVLSACPVCNVDALWPNGWTDQDEIWHAGRPPPWPHCVRRGPSSPPTKGHSPQIFGPYLLRPNGWMDQDATWYGGRPRSGRLCVRWDPTPLPKRRRSPQFFSAHVYLHLVRR